MLLYIISYMPKPQGEDTITWRALTAKYPQQHLPVLPILIKWVSGHQYFLRTHMHIYNNCDDKNGYSLSSLFPFYVISAIKLFLNFKRNIDTQIS